VASSSNNPQVSSKWPRNRRFHESDFNPILFLQRNKHARSRMRLAICKQTARGDIWLVGYALGPEWGSYEEALHFHSLTEAEMTFKFLPRADRRSASIVDWPVLPHLPILMTGT
jgi:hypothetical protein